MSQYSQISRDILKLRVEQQQLEKDEKILRELILKIRNQQNAVQVERLEIQIRQPELTDDYLKELASGATKEPELGSTDILEQMVKGNFVIEEEENFKV